MRGLTSSFRDRFSPDGRKLAVVDRSRSGNTLRVFDATTGEIVLTRALPGSPLPTFALRYSPDGMLLALGTDEASRSPEIKVLDASDGRELKSLTGHRFTIVDLAFSPDGRRLASAAMALGAGTRGVDSEVKLWDLATGRDLLTFAAGINPKLAFSPDGFRLSCISDVATKVAEVQIWDATPLPDDPSDPQP